MESRLKSGMGIRSTLPEGWAPSSTSTSSTATCDLGPRQRRRKDRTINWWATTIVAFCSLTVLLPLYFTVVTALKTPDQLGGSSLALPTEVMWEPGTTSCCRW